MCLNLVGCWRWLLFVVRFLFVCFVLFVFVVCCVLFVVVGGVDEYDDADAGSVADVQ